MAYRLIVAALFVACAFSVALAHSPAHSEVDAVIPSTVNDDVARLPTVEGTVAEEVMEAGGELESRMLQDDEALTEIVDALDFSPVDVKLVEDVTEEYSGSDEESSEEESEFDSYSDEAGSYSSDSGSYSSVSGSYSSEETSGNEESEFYEGSDDVTEEYVSESSDEGLVTVDDEGDVEEIERRLAALGDSTMINDQVIEKVVSEMEQAEEIVEEVAALSQPTVDESARRVLRTTA